ncbi:transcriptional regulator [Bartonella tribocorum CIP 105476]|uniref:Transcriptional regulator n=2 Tax=Bartonella tribocorum TaxID=85701 RepID=A9IYN2_BART1|nr:transcriptional regulator [Bartonella tribocorum CIP 105476]
MSQTTLGHALGVSFQQIQKYEKGLNRVSAGRLMQISDILNVPISFFYADIITKQQPPHHHDEVISSTEEYLLLKRFRTLTSINKEPFYSLSWMRMQANTTHERTTFSIKRYALFKAILPRYECFIFLS